MEKGGGVLVAETPNGDGNGQRATVQLVDAKLDTIRAELQGGFTNIQRQLDDQKWVIPAVESLRERQALSEARLKVMEDTHAAELAAAQQAARDARDAANASRAWWRTYTAKDIPFFLIAASGFIFALLHH